MPAIVFFSALGRSEGRADIVDTGDPAIQILDAYAIALSNYWHSHELIEWGCSL